MENAYEVLVPRVIVSILSVDLDGDDSIGHFVNADGDLAKVRLTYGEALAMQKEFRNGAPGVGYEIPEVLNRTEVSGEDDDKPDLSKLDDGELETLHRLIAKASDQR